jgi:hypothetical protein
MQRKNLGLSMVVAGLLAGSFLAGGILINSGGSGASNNIGGANTSSPMAVFSTASATPASATATLPTVTTPAATGIGSEGGASSVPGGSAGALIPVGGTQTGGAPEGIGSVPENPAPATAVPPVATPVPPTPVPPTPVPPVVEPEVEEVNEVPFVVSATPGDKEMGVALNTKIRVTFSEAMDPASTEAAFSILPNVAGSFAWNAEQTEMTFTPNASFTYNTKVEWSVAASAQDATGLAMAEGYGGSFSLLRQKTINLYSQPHRDGYVYAPPVAALQHVNTAPVPGHNSLMVGSWMRGFLSFDLALLPASTVEITAAQLHIHQRAHHAQAFTAETGALWIVSLPYGDLDISDYSKPTPTICGNICYPLGVELSNSAADGWKSVDLTTLVKMDWNNTKGDINALAIPGAERLSQFRLQFLNENKGAGPDVWAEFHSGESGSAAPKLQVTFVYK